ncbi:hypothetical protein Tco_1003477 [Tanacetum coccineum]|uniref:Uncharacterized protein n=1 Tax=Tanacetum coccineum TaxID=301880 RepID=A0ABQ5FAB4_9ASTR
MNLSVRTSVDYFYERFSFYDPNVVNIKEVEHESDIQEKEAKNKQNQARDGKDQVKSKSKVNHIEVFSNWMAFRGNIRDLGSFGEETDEITDLHQILEEVLLTARGDGITGITRRRRDPSGSRKPAFVCIAVNTSKETRKSLTTTATKADQPKDDAAPTQGKPDWFKQPPRPPTPDPKWNKGKNVDDGPEQPLFNDLVYAKKDPLTFDKLMATPINFSKFVMNHLKLDKITKGDLVGPIYKLLKGTCKSDRCLYDLSKPLSLQGSPCHLTILFDFFYNNDLEYLKTENSKRKYTVSITKTKATRFSKHNVYSTMKILSVVGVNIDTQFGYGYLQEIVMRRVDRKLYTFKEGDFPNLHLNDIEYMLLLHVQNKLFNLDGDDIVDLVVALRMFTRRIVIQERVEDVQLGVEIYQKKLNISKPQKEFPGISAKEPYITSYDLKGVVYLDSRDQKRLMRADELYKFFDGTLKSVREILHYRLLNFKLGYNTDMPKRKWTEKDHNQTDIMVQLIDKQLLERRIM